MYCIAVSIICLSAENTRRFIELANRRRMLGPNYVYIILSERVDDGIYRPWGERPQQWSDERWSEYRNLFASLRFVRHVGSSVLSGGDMASVLLFH